MFRPLGSVARVTVIASLIAGCAHFGENVRKPEDVELELKARTQALMDGIADGDRRLWSEALAPNAMIVDESGQVLGKNAMLDQLVPLPKAFAGHIEVTDFQVTMHGEIAFTSHLDIEKETIFGSVLTAQFRTTDTWRWSDERWQLMGSHVTPVPGMRTAVNLDPKLLDRYVGEYMIGEGERGWIYAVTRIGDRLYGAPRGRPREELLPLADRIFFRKGDDRGEKVFVIGDDGQAVEMRDRRENRDLVWKRLP